MLNEENPTAADIEENEIQSSILPTIDMFVILPNSKCVKLPSIGYNDNINANRQYLSELPESAYYTSYRLDLVNLVDDKNNICLAENEPTICDEFLDLISVFGGRNDIKACILSLKLMDYDVKKVKTQLKKTRELIVYQQLSIAEVFDGSISVLLKKICGESSDVNDCNKNQSTSDEPPTLTNDLRLPMDSELTSLGNFSDFYNETLFRKTFAESLNSQLAKTRLSDVVKSISASGWNPPPPNRKLVGDLLYIEVVTATEGVIYLTAVSSGFYVNKCNRNHFDPNPAAQCHFAHELFITLLGVSSLLQSTWVNIISKYPAVDEGKPLESVAALFMQGRGDQISLKPQWNVFNAELLVNTLNIDNNVPTDDVLRSTKAAVVDKFSHKYDSYRVQTDIIDLITLGTDEIGSSREWNEETQQIRAIPAKDINEVIMKARLEYKIITEFTEACKSLALAISDGLITPLNAYEPQSPSQIFMHNGIFLSKAVDTKDSFKLFTGDEAMRKATTRDLNNHKIVRSLGISGLSTVVLTIIDFKGDRIVGQSMIPGIITQSENHARLMYGILEKEKSLIVKNSSLKVMEELGKKLHIAKRNVKLFPSGNDKETSESQVSIVEEDKTAKDSVVAPIEEIPQSVKIDDIDNVEVSLQGDIETIPHVGPLECKLLEGTDGKMYALELLRLTPRDANFVKGEKGTGKLASEVLDKVDDNIAVTYVIRHELVGLFIQAKVDKMKNELNVELAQDEKFASLKLNKKDDDQFVVKSENKEESLESKPTTSTNDDDFAAIKTKLLSRLEQINSESQNFDLNCNVFIDDFVADVNPEVLLKDEQTARELALFLFNDMLPNIVKQVRDGEFIAKDNIDMIQHLHRIGVNVRYLGVLARLSLAEEAVDIELLEHSKQRVFSMPQYWTNMILIEMVARSIKHILNGFYRNNSQVKASPAATIASVLHHLFSTLSVPKQDENDLQKPPVVDAKNKVNGSTNHNKKKKKKNHNDKEENEFVEVTQDPSNTITNNQIKKKNGKSDFDLIEGMTVMNVIPGPPNAAENGEELLSLLNDTILTRFGFKINFHENESDENTHKNDVSLKALKYRLSPLMLLRRICQVCGLRIATKDYNFNSSVGMKNNTQMIFKMEDIIELVPIVKSCEPDMIMPEVNEMIYGSSIHLQEGNIKYAFDLAQQATTIISQISGPIHNNGIQASHQFAAVLIAAGEMEAAIQTSNKSLLLAVQVNGLDSSETLQQHEQLAALYLEMKEYPEALSHLLAARYLILLLGGPTHIGLCNIYNKLATIYDAMGQIQVSFTCLQQARTLTNSIHIYAAITSIIADKLFKHGFAKEATTEQKTSYKMMKELYGDREEFSDKLEEAKKNLETYIRGANDPKLVQQQQLSSIQQLINFRTNGNFTREKEEELDKLIESWNLTMGLKSQEKQELTTVDAGVGAEEEEDGVNGVGGQHEASKKKKSAKKKNASKGKK
eukprot:gene5210-7248_t